MKLSSITIVAVVIILMLVGLFFAFRPTTDAPQTKTTAVKITETGMTPNNISYNEGDTALLKFTSSTDAIIHIHGYNVELPVSAEKTSEIELQLTRTGRFEIELHHNDEEHEHKHDHDHTCQAEIPVGAPQPQIEVKAEEAEETGKILISVELRDFEFTPQNGKNPVTTGHWHLFLDDVATGMFTDTEIVIPLDQPGKHRIKASLADTNHCEYGIEDETTILIPGHAPHDTSTTTNKHDNTEHGSSATTHLGFLDVQPRNP
ncbi:MAG: hypothetical protein FI725_04105 [SAR202 cluster bacterium]|nr:hypothetical protein [SAR202 cluster bacterium]